MTPADCETLKMKRHASISVVLPEGTTVLAQILRQVASNLAEGMSWMRSKALAAGRMGVMERI